MVSLTNTLYPWRAHIARGVLEAHGINAFVRHDATASVYGALASGGCDLMVEEEDLGQAGEILNAIPPPAADGDAGEPSEATPLKKVLRTAAFCGAEIFLVLAVLMALPRLIYIFTSSTGLQTLLKPLGAWLYQLPSHLVFWVLAGAGMGLGTGLLVWLLADFRRRKGVAGRIFIGLLGVALLVIGPLLSV